MYNSLSSCLEILDSNEHFAFCICLDLHGSHNCFRGIMLIPSSPVHFGASHAFEIVRIALGPVGVKYNDDRLGVSP